MTESEELNVQNGPCIVCGRKNYPLSCGGPTICPSCDCGIDPKLSQANQQIYSLLKEISRLRGLLKEARESLNETKLYLYPGAVFGDPIRTRKQTETLVAKIDEALK